MAAIWHIDPSLAGPPLSEEQREKSRIALQRRLAATLARIGEGMEQEERRQKELLAALNWCRSNGNPHLAML